MKCAELVVIDAAHDGRYQRDTHFQRVTDGDGALFKLQKRACAERYINGVIQSIKLQEDDADARVAKRPRIVRLLREANAVGVDLDVLTAKVQAVIRRSYSFASSVNLMEHGGAVLNLGNGTLSVGGETLELTRNELKILQILFENNGRVVSREAIMTRLWESDSFVDDNTLTVNITRLRKKLESVGLTDFIVTKKGLGYIV